MTKITYQLSLFQRIVRTLLRQGKQVLPAAVYGSLYSLARKSKQSLERTQYELALKRLDRKGQDDEEVAKRRLVLELLPFTMGGPKSLENAFEVSRLVDNENVDGALVECGVALGGNAAMLAVTNRRFGGTTRDVWLFDSFEGLPAPGEHDFVDGDVGTSITPLGEGECVGTLEEVQALMHDQLGFSTAEVHYVEGWFQDTVPQSRAKVGDIAVLRLDGDWYESTKVPLENLFPSVSPGGVVIVDDYATCYGSRKAVDEFLTEEGLSVDLQPDGRGGMWFRKEQTNVAAEL